MKIELAYGKNGLEIDLPDNLNTTVIEPHFSLGLSNPHEALRQSLRKPIESRSLQDLVPISSKVGIIFSDITRPTPNKIIIPVILDELSYIPKNRISLFNSLGTHRPNTEAELKTMLGTSIIENYCIVQNDAINKSTQRMLGTTSRGHEIWLNRELAECDVKILTGFIEPHFFAGFSGAGKAVMPGMAGLQTILSNHSTDMIGDKQATWGITFGNPIWEEIREVALKINPTFLVNVALNRNKEITGIFSGNMDEAHKAGCAFVKNVSMIPVPHSFDIVITSNSGYPQDLNLYQCVKGMSVASQVVKEGGAIIVAADCWDGIPNHGIYSRLLTQSDTPQDLLNTIHTPGFSKQDQWQAQIQAQIQLKADVYIFTDNLTDKQIVDAMLLPCSRIEDTVTKLVAKYGPNTSICVLPEGPQSIPYIDL